METKRGRLGEGVYVEFDGKTLTVGSMNDKGQNDEVYLGPKVYPKLVVWMTEQLQAQPGDDIAKAIKHEGDFR